MDQKPKHIYDVEVSGVRLKIRSSHNAETVAELVQYVDQKISDVIATQNAVSFQNSLLLAALNIAEELLLMKKAAHHELEKIEERTKNIIEKIEDRDL
jgi:cell division protein ZapA